MKKVFAMIVAGLFFAAANSAQAAPPDASNPNVVAYHETGPHGIPGDPTTHVGLDVVMRAGNSGNFLQWFVGTHEGESDVHGHLSLWRYSPNKECKAGEVEYVSTPSNFWGDYLVQNERYCVTTNEFQVNE